MNSLLDLESIPKLVGETAKDRFFECQDVLMSIKWPVFLVGPSGSGKTVMAMNLAKAYSLRRNVPAYYVQLSPEQTKTSLILGLRLVEGSLVPVKGLLAQAMEEGGIVVVDEATHTTQELLLMFNSILDRTSITAIGDETVYAKPTFRVVFAANDSLYAGNVRLPQSFAQRMMTWYFDYPSWEDEVAIARKIADLECEKKIDVPDCVTKYLTSFVRSVRNESFPLSARNIAAAIIRLALVSKKDQITLDEYFTRQSTAESLRRTIAARIANKSTDSITNVRNTEVNEFMEYVTGVGLDRFREIVLSSCMYYLDVDGMELNRDVKKNELAGKVL